MSIDWVPAEVKATDHIVVVGYLPGRTERLVDEILADIDGRRLVLCAAPDTLTHPIPDRDVDFVFAGNMLLRRSAIQRVGFFAESLALYEDEEERRRLAGATSGSAFK